MHQTVRLRTRPTSQHPPYGLFVDPHRSSHTWWAVDARTLLGIIALLGGLGAALSFAAR